MPHALCGVSERIAAFTATDNGNEEKKEKRRRGGWFSFGLECIQHGTRRSASVIDASRSPKWAILILEPQEGMPSRLSITQPHSSVATTKRLPNCEWTVSPHIEEHMILDSHFEQRAEAFFVLLCNYVAQRTDEASWPEHVQLPHMLLNYLQIGFR